MKSETKCHNGTMNIASLRDIWARQRLIQMHWDMMFTTKFGRLQPDRVVEFIRELVTELVADGKLRREEVYDLL